VYTFETAFNTRINALIFAQEALLWQFETGLDYAACFIYSCQRRKADD
jgi:hypothetical protein